MSKVKDFIVKCLFLLLGTVCILGLGYSVYMLTWEITTGAEKREVQYEIDRKEGRRFGNYQIITLDGCEYLRFGYHMLAHKGNCKRCKETP